MFEFGFLVFNFSFLELLQVIHNIISDDFIEIEILIHIYLYKIL